MDFDYIMAYGLDVAGFGGARQNVNDKLKLKRFRSHFGIGPKAILAMLKDMKIDLEDKRNNKKVLKHIMMTLCWLKLYETECVMAGRWGFGEEYCRNTVKSFASKIQHLKARKIRFGSGILDPRRVYLGSVDCVHCPVNEFRTDPHSKWYSHKLNAAGLTYEVVIDVCSSNALWVAGPKPASTHDITFFRGGTEVSKDRKKNEATWDSNALYFQIPKDKRLIGDSGYKGEPKKISTTSREHNEEVKEFFARAKSRQESFNTRLKFFNVLSGCFRHGKGVADKLEFHKICFEAVCVLVQYDMENGHPLLVI